MISILQRLHLSLVITLVLISVTYVPDSSAQVWDQLFNEQLDSAEAGDPDAQYEVAIMYLNGRGVEQNFDETMRWLERAAGNGSEQASSKLRRIQGQKKKFTSTLKRAESGNSKAQYDVGMMYLKGRGVKLDAATGRQWLEKAAAQSHEKAVTRLAILLLKGEGGTPDYGRARKLLNSISESSALAQYYLGEVYSSGRGVPRDYEAAMDWYRKAADNGFSMAGGKIINMEEEIRMQARRNVNAKKAADNKVQQQLARQEKVRQRKAAQAEAARNAKAAKAKKLAKKSATKSKPAARSPAKPSPVKKVVQLSPLEKLASTQWSARNKPMEYLPSAISQCGMEDGTLICFSEELKRESGNQTVLYKVKSEVRRTKGGFSIAYRNLVLGVEDMEVPDDAEDALGYDDEVDQGFAIQTGWTRAHRVECKLDGDKAMNCVKNKTHRIHVVEDVQLAVTEKE
jgi:TPR repeat protein